MCVYSLLILDLYAVYFDHVHPTPINALYVPELTSSSLSQPHVFINIILIFIINNHVCPTSAMHLCTIWGHPLKCGQPVSDHIP